MEVTASRTSAHGARHRSVKDSLYSRSPAGRSYGPWKAPVVFHVLEIFFRGKRNFPEIVRGGAGRAGLCRGARRGWKDPALYLGKCFITMTHAFCDRD